MIERYTRPEMGKIWTEQAKFEAWLAVELAATDAMAHYGYIPKGIPSKIKKKAKVNAKRILKIEETVKHDVIAFLTSITEIVGDPGKYLHFGMTSSDVLDTALALQIKDASAILTKQMQRLIKALAKQARKHKNTLMVGRSHGVHAEPITFGLKMALFYEEMCRNRERLEAASVNMQYGKISGAVGTFANIEPKIERYVCAKLGLKPEPVSNQIIQRDRHAEYISTLAIIGSSLEKLALEIRHLQKTETLEAEEQFTKGQKGSSAMPHKKNPIICERVCGLARLLRGNAVAAMENIPLWHERDISHSSVERVIFPDSTITLDYMLDKMVGIIENLVVFKDNMFRNLEASNGRVFSQGLLLRLIKKGVTREVAYKIVQDCAMQSWQSGEDFRDIAANDKKVSAYIPAKEIREIFDYSYHTKNIGVIFKRLGLGK
ncbi:MAG: adenylosuccinate lyase [Candidatus Omnitrophica bacterium]|nr:adenylosuccinate lyase [Candidatus Omnitrophota bacterium]